VPKKLLLLILILPFFLNKTCPDPQFGMPPIRSPWHFCSLLIAWLVYVTKYFQKEYIIFPSSRSFILLFLELELLLHFGIYLVSLLIFWKHLPLLVVRFTKDISDTFTLTFLTVLTNK
jgi:hypothetical protein